MEKTIIDALVLEGQKQLSLLSSHAVQLAVDLAQARLINKELVAKCEALETAAKPIKSVAKGKFHAKPA
jgi:hypothetical protein